MWEKRDGAYHREDFEVEEGLYLTRDGREIYVTPDYDEWNPWYFTSDQGRSGYKRDGRFHDRSQSGRDLMKRLPYRMLDE